MIANENEFKVAKGGNRKERGGALELYFQTPMEIPQTQQQQIQKNHEHTQTHIKEFQN